MEETEIEIGTHIQYTKTTTETSREMVMIKEIEIGYNNRHGHIPNSSSRLRVHNQVYYC